jgi:peptide-methionine (S)-S-oxide reductase
MIRIHVTAHAKGLCAVLVAAAILLPLGSRAAMAEEARIIPAPALDESAANEGGRTVVLAGGCFWGVQGVFQHTKGVIGAVSGYAGVTRSPPSMKR